MTPQDGTVLVRSSIIVFGWTRRALLVIAEALSPEPMHTIDVCPRNEGGREYRRVHLVENLLLDPAVVVADLGVVAVVVLATAPDAPADDADEVPAIPSLHHEGAATVALAGVAHDLLLVAGAEHVPGHRVLRGRLAGLVVDDGQPDLLQEPR